MQTPESWEVDSLHLHPSQEKTSVFDSFSKPLRAFTSTATYTLGI